ncbi:MAG TPA: BBP7 family outer membrane beta-barrel protein, partial [Gemmataceae bacterium]|nr:BBP7 family outer membrane beta-barrel protein [Gemmataceae bacterium]
MRKGFLCSLGAVLAGAGLAVAQPAPAYRPARDVSFPQAMPASPAPVYTAAPQFAPAQWYPMPASPAGPWGYPMTAPVMVAPQYATYPAPIYPRPAVSAAGVQMPQPMPSAPDQPVQVVPEESPGETAQPPKNPEPTKPPKSPEKIPPPKKPVEEIRPPATPAPEEDVCPGWPVFPGDGCPVFPDDCCAEESPLAREERAEKAKKEREPRFWAGADYLNWRLQDGPLPVPLVTTSSPASQGIAGAPDTVVLAGPVHALEFQQLDGLRVTAGFWLSSCLGVEGSGFVLEQGADGFSATSTGAPLLARPAINGFTGMPGSLLVAAPGIAAGGVDVHGTSQLFGSEVNLLLNAFRGCAFRLNLLTGFRYVDLREGLDIAQNSLVLGPALAFGGAPLGVGSSLAVADAIDTRTQFYGGQVGLQSGVQFGRVFVATTAKIALGTNHQVVSATGVTTQLDTGASLPGGLLVLPSNSVRRANDTFSILPEGSVEVGLQVSKRVSVSLGYSFLYWTRVVRPGDQLNQTVTPTQLPTSQVF